VCRVQWRIPTADEGLGQLEAHGQGTTAGDAEVQALKNMYMQACKFKSVVLSDIAVRQTADKEERMRQEATRKAANHAASLSSGISPSRLSRKDAGEVNKEHQLITQRLQIEPVWSEVAHDAGYRALLEWKWKNLAGRTNAMTASGIGGSKAVARAEAAIKMLHQTGLQAAIDPQHRAEATAIKEALLRQDMADAVNRTCSLIHGSPPHTWAIFLPHVWRMLLAHVSLLEADALPNGPLPPLVQNVMVAIKTAANDRDGGRVMGVDVWESLLDECPAISARSTSLANRVLDQLVHVPFSPDCFPDLHAYDYFRSMRGLMAFERTEELQQRVDEKRTFYPDACLVMSCEEAVYPMVRLHTFIQDGTQLRKFAEQPLREGDILCLMPTRAKTQDPWGSCFFCRVTSLVKDGGSLVVNLKCASEEPFWDPALISHDEYSVYHIASHVSWLRMTQAIKALAAKRMPPLQGEPPFRYQPEMRLLLLSPTHQHAPTVAQGVSMPEDLRQHMSYEGFRGHPFWEGRSKDGASFETQLWQNMHNNTRRETLKAGKEMQTAASEISDHLATHEEASTAAAASDEGAPLQCPEGLLRNLGVSMPLTEPQQRAVQSALTNRLTLVQGPPGTGKTHTACAIIDAWKRLDSSQRILAVADSNIAADNISAGLRKRSIASLRVGAFRDSDLHDDAIKDMRGYDQYVELRRSGRREEANARRFLLIKEAVRRHTIIIATCIGSGHEMFDEVTFSKVLIDECAQAIEPSSLVPLGRGVDQIVLIGDQKQLPPTILCESAAARGLEVSLFERLLNSNVTEAIMLETQRRMHRSIADFPNRHFYDGRLKDAGVGDDERPPIAGLHWPQGGQCRVALVDVAGCGEEASGTSRANRREIAPLLRVLVQALEHRSVEPTEIGVLTPYVAQKRLLIDALRDMQAGISTSSAWLQGALSGVQVDTIDGFQGMEKDIILFSAVRANAAGALGFLRDPRRMNVMLTRARRGLVVFGDVSTLRQDSRDWGPWVQWAGERGAVIRDGRMDEAFLAA